MALSPIGKIADTIWQEIRHHAKNIEIGEYIIIPNHVHGILIICDGDNKSNFVETGHALSLPHTMSLRSTHDNNYENIGKQRFQNIGKNSISSIVGSYKSAVAKHAHRLDYKLEWQQRFYDHIIRNENEYKRIVDYINENPIKWADNNKKYGITSLP